MNPDIRVDLEFTPNPNTLKYVTSVALLLSGAKNFKSKDEVKGQSKLAEKLFALNGISAVMVGKNFVTVTLSDQDSLTELNDQIIDTIKGFLMTGEPAVDPSALIETQVGGNDIESKIIKILDDEIRPA